MTPTEQEYIKLIFKAWKEHTLAMYGHIIDNAPKLQHSIDRDLNHKTWLLLMNTGVQYDVIIPDKDGQRRTDFEELLELLAA